MLLGRACGFALAALVLLADRDPSDVVAAEEIAHGTGVPLEYLRKLLQRLVRAGLVHSGRGRGGGFRLARSPSQITLLQFVEAIDGPMSPDMLLSAPLVPAHPGILNGLAFCRGQLSTRLRSVLAEFTLADLTASSALSAGVGSSLHG